jgi:hypothetical protein
MRFFLAFSVCYHKERFAFEIWFPMISLLAFPHRQVNENMNMKAKISSEYFYLLLPH